MAIEKLRFAAVGCRHQAWADITRITAHPAVEPVAFCDIDQRHFKEVNKKWPDKPQFSDYRKMFAEMKEEIDAVLVAVPDHSHAIITQAALDHGFHVYCEKPLTHTVWEARQIANQAKASGLVTRMGNQIHSEYQYRVIKEVIQKEKVIGKVKEVHTWISAGGHGRSGYLNRPENPESAPPEVDWDQWIGPAPMREYGGDYVYHPRFWRDWQDFGTGSIGDNGCHLFDPIFTSIGLTAPLSVMADHSGMNDEVYPAQETLSYIFPGTAFTTEDTLKVTWYDGGRRPGLNVEGVPSGSALPAIGSIIVGEKGYLLVNHREDPVLYPEANFADFKWPELELENHYFGWVEACLAGNPDISDNFAYAGPLTEAVQLGNVAIHFPGERLEWDTDALKITNLPEANGKLTRSYRKGWEVKAFPG